MKRKTIKKTVVVALSMVMMIGVIPAVSKPLEVQAATNTVPTAAYWTDVNGLKSYSMASSGTTIGKIKFGLNDSETRLWAIAGNDTSDITGNSLAVLSTSKFVNSDNGSRSYSKSNFVTDMNTYLDTSYFSLGEMNKMKAVTVKTNEPDGNGGYEEAVLSDKKLYLPNSKDENSDGETTIYVGANNDIAIDMINNVSSANGFLMDYFWLRSPSADNQFSVCIAQCGDGVSIETIDMPYGSYVPAFNLDLSSVLFASAANAASSSNEGDLTSTMSANTYTVRYASSGSECAVVNSDETSVKISGASDGMYLVVQNSEGAYAADASSHSDITANDISINGTTLDNFKNCKIWLESTDSDRITTAKEASVLESTAKETTTVATLTTGTAASETTTSPKTGEETLCLWQIILAGVAGSILIYMKRKSEKRRKIWEE